MALTTERIREIERSHVYNRTATLVDFARAIEAEVRKQDDALIRQMLDALFRAQTHHYTTSLPLAIANYGSREACGIEGAAVWRELFPQAIAAARARLEGKP